LRQIKYYLFSLKYKSSIDFIFAIGNKGRECFERTVFESRRIFDWGYFTEAKEVHQKPYQIENKQDVNLIYVGRLTKSKGILKLVKNCKELENEFSSLTIIGDGAERKNLEEMIGDSLKYKYLGTKPNKEVLDAISRADLMVLPSTGKDGWGAVINESLMLGVPVIASNYCGASVLLDGDVRGEVFSVEKDNLLPVLKKWVEKGKYTEGDRGKIIAWSKKNISGRAAANYFLDVINFTYNNELGIPRAPWLSDICYY